MDRRSFIKNGVLFGAVPIVLPFFPVRFGTDKSRAGTVKPAWLMEMIVINDQTVENILKRRVNDLEDSLFGAVMDGFEIASPHAVVGFVKAGVCALATEESRWFNNQKLLGDLIGSARFLLTLQHADGTIDLLTTNFHSTPDTAFLVKYLCPAVAVLQRSKVGGIDDLLLPLKQFLQSAGKALIVGGVHTPNHRWVLAAAMASLNRLWANPEYEERAAAWLAEGIDLDEDGQYQEKSSYIYSSLSDRALITVARGLEKDWLLDVVRRNLQMTLYLIHPNGEIVTEASGRQDNSIVGTLENYYYPYRYLAIKDNNEQYAAACQVIEATAFDKTAAFIQYFLEDEMLWKELPRADNLPVDYFKTFSNSDLIRIRRGSYDASVLPKNPVFFTFHKNNAVLQGLRVASAFFGKGQFTADSYKVEEGVIQMKSSLEGAYYQPFPKEKIPGDGIWEKMPRNEREQSEIQYLETAIRIHEIEGGFELEMEIGGTERVPLVVELIFRPGGIIKNSIPHTDVADVYFLKEGFGQYEFEGEIVEFGPGHHEHAWVDIRGALPRMAAPTVYLTGFTPFKKRIRIS